MKRTIFAFTCLLLISSASSQINLSNGNTTATIDPTTNPLSFLRGMNSWEVDGVDQLFQQWYWFRIGNTAERTIDSGAALSVSGLTANTATITYIHSSVRFDLTFTLVGGVAGSGTADVSEIMRVTNLTNQVLDLHLFEYDDFDLDGTFGGDSAVRLDPSSIRQSDAISSVTVGAVPAASHWQIGAVPSIFDAIEDGVATTLSDSGSPFGPGDASFAMQWDVSMNSHSSFLMSKNKIVTAVPEAASMAILGLGTVGLLRRRAKAIKKSYDS